MQWNYMFAKRIKFILLFCYNLSRALLAFLGGGLGCCGVRWSFSDWSRMCAAMSISSDVMSRASCISLATKSGSQYFPSPCCCSTRPTRFSAEPTTSNATGRAPACCGLDGIEWGARVWLIPFLAVGGPTVMKSKRALVNIIWQKNGGKNTLQREKE